MKTPVIVVAFSLAFGLVGCAVSSEDPKPEDPKPTTPEQIEQTTSARSYCDPAGCMDACNNCNGSRGTCVGTRCVCSSSQMCQ